AGEPRLWWDGAHNPQGLAALVAAWGECGFPAPAALVLAISRDKPAEEVLEALAPLLAGATLIVTRSRNERAMDPASLAATAHALRDSTGVTRDSLATPALAMSPARRDSIAKARAALQPRPRKPAAGAPEPPLRFSADNMSGSHDEQGDIVLLNGNLRITRGR